MGLGPSNLVILRTDEDIRKLEWGDIEEQLAFFRRWDMEDVSSALKKFKGLKRSLDKNRQALSPDDAYDLVNRRTNWSEYYKICYDVETARQRKLDERDRAIWHPATQSFAMSVDTAALDAYDEYILGDTIRPADEPYDDDAHTDDEPSEDEGGDEGDEGGDDDDIDSATREGVDSSLGGGTGEPLAIESAGGGEAARGQDNDGGGDGFGPRALTAAGDVEGGAPGTVVTDVGGGRGSSIDLGANGYEYVGGRFTDPHNSAASEQLRVESRPLPLQFDPKAYSPIFFGFATKTVKAVYAEEASKGAKREKREKEVVRRLLQQRREEIEKTREEFGTRRFGRQRRVGRMQKAHSEASKKRKLELDTAAKMTSPGELRAFKSVWDKDERAVLLANGAEAEELDAHNLKIANDEDLKLNRLVSAAASAEAAQSFERPSGDKLEADGRVGLAQRVLELDEACRALEDALQKLSMTRDEQQQEKEDGGGEEENGDGGGRGSNARSILIRLEADVDRAQRMVDQTLVAVDEGEVVLGRAVRRRGRERNLLPLYKPLATSLEDDDFTSPVLQVVGAMLVACTDAVAEKLRVLVTLFDMDNDGWLSKAELTALVFNTAQVLKALGYFKTFVSEEEAESAVLRCLHDVGVKKDQSPEDGLTLFEAKKWVTGLISKSPWLSSLFGVNFQYGELSAYQRQTSSVAKQFEMGLVELPDLKYHSAKSAVTYRALLHPDAKLTVHERSLSLGSDDPLKTDYSRFLPKKKKRALTNVVPLEHGHLANTTVQRFQTLTKSATKLQNYYRGLQARRKAEAQARGQAFLHAKAVALDEARKGVEAEFEGKEALEGSSKMKWDSKLRLRQSKLTAQGKVVDRGAVLAMYLDEAIAAKEAQVQARFHELAVARGFEDPQPKHGGGKKQKKSGNHGSRGEEGSGEEEGEGDDDDGNDEGNSAAPHGREARKGKKKKSMAQRMIHEDEPELLDKEIMTPRAKNEDGEDGEAPETGHDPGGKKPKGAKKKKTKGGKEVSAATAFAHLEVTPSSTTTERRRAMMLGSYPHDLFATGMTDEEKTLSMRLAVPDPGPNELFARLCALNSTFTQLKTEDLLRELPTKALLAKYVWSWRHADELEKDLLAHFRLVRDAGSISTALRQVVGTDLESGLMTQVAAQMRLEQDACLHSVALHDAELGFKIAQSKAEKAVRTARGTDASDTPERKLLDLFEKEGQEIVKRSEAASELEASMEKLAKKLRATKLSLSELGRRRTHLERYVRQSTQASKKEQEKKKKQQQQQQQQQLLLDNNASNFAENDNFAENSGALAGFGTDLEDSEEEDEDDDEFALHAGGGESLAGPELRFDWMKRYTAAMAAPESEEDDGHGRGYDSGKVAGQGAESKAKYTELASVGQEFLDAATRGARMLVDELFLPLPQRTLQPVSERALDGRSKEAGRGCVAGGDQDGGVRYKFEAFNIRFKVWVDDHGLFNGSDEFSAKAAGNDLRACLEYCKCRLTDVLFPLECTVDYHGFRVLCVAKLPIELTVFSESGDLRRVGEEMVLGTADRGETVVNGNLVVDNRMAEAARKLNLARHGVKGTKDILNKFLYSAVDVRVFKGKDQGAFGALNFWRALPGEHPEATPHLSEAPRGQSLFWRMLRPELVKSNVVSEARVEALLEEVNTKFKPSDFIGGGTLALQGALTEEHRQLWATLPADMKQRVVEWRSTVVNGVAGVACDVKVALSPDANVLIEYGCPDWEPHIWAVRDASIRLVDEVIPAFAASLARRDLGPGASMQTGYGVHLTSDLHRHGIGCRHLGLLRTYFWRPVKGLVSVVYNSAVLECDGGDLRSQVKRGDFVVLHTETQKVQSALGQASEHYRVCPQASSGAGAEHSAKHITLETTLKELSVNGLELSVGRLHDERNSAEMRQLLLAEMVARTIKNILRYYLRCVAKQNKAVSASLHAFVLCCFLNLATGAHENAEDFWSGQLFHGLRSRFGVCACSDVERVNLRLSCEPCTVYVVNRLADMVGVRLSSKCVAHFNEEPVAFTFTQADLEPEGGGASSGAGSGLRVKHNVGALEFAKAQLLSTQAGSRRVTGYEQLVAQHGALLYLKLNERRGSRIAFNKGTAGMRLAGSYSRGVRMESVGPIANDDMNRAVLFDRNASTTPRIDLKYSPELAPMAEDQWWCVECWCRTASAGQATHRVVVMSGRYELCATREDKWSLSVFSGVADVVVSGPRAESGKWVHLVADYDGTLARLWVNSELCGSAEVAPLMSREVDRKAQEFEGIKERLILAEVKARDNCKRLTDEQASAYFKTKEGGERVRAAAQTLVEHSEFKVKMDARAAEKGLKAVEVGEAKTLAREEYRQQLYMKNVQAIAEAHRKRMEEHVDSLMKDREEASERATKPLRIGAAVGSKRAAGGRFLFSGEVCHVAVYVGEGSTLSQDQIRCHYLSGVQPRSLQADRIFALAAQKFQAALEFAPDDRQVLEKYAQSLCLSLVFDSTGPSDSDAVRRNKLKVVEAVGVFVDHENADALAEVLRRLPAEHKYGDLAVGTYDALTGLDPHYFTVSSHMSLRELSTLPSKFSLSLPGNDANSLRVAADIYRRVLAEPVLSNCFGEEMLAWASDLHSSEVVCALVAQAETDSDKRLLDLHQFGDVGNMGDGDLHRIADHRRLTLSLNLTGCELVSDGGVHGMAKCCTSLQALTLDGCAQLTNASLEALKRFTPALNLLSCQKCPEFSSAALASLFHSCRGLRVLNLNLCRAVSDECLGSLARCCKHLELLHVSHCTGVTDGGLYDFAMACNPKPLRSVDLSYCRGVGDDAVEVLAKKCVHLTWLNLKGLSRVTDHGAKAVTHNVWGLQHLDLEELFLVTDAAFFFDHERDGRKAADSAMLTQVTELNVSECTLLSDRCLGGIATRCEKLRSFHCAGLSSLTPSGFHDFVEEPLAKTARGGHLRVLNLSFVSSLDDKALDVVCRACPELETLNLAGCVLVTDSGVKQLCSTCGHVKSLGLSFVKRVSDAALCSMADFLWLEHLDVSGCSNLTDDGVEVLCLEFAGLVKLDVSGCSKLTDAAIESIGRHSEHMRWLKIANLANQISDAALTSLREKQSSLQVITTNLVDETDGKLLDRIVFE